MASGFVLLNKVLSQNLEFELTFGLEDFGLTWLDPRKTNEIEQNDTNIFTLPVLFNAFKSFCENSDQKQSFPKCFAIDKIHPVAIAYNVKIDESFCITLLSFHQRLHRKKVNKQTSTL